MIAGSWSYLWATIVGDDGICYYSTGIKGLSPSGSHVGGGGGGGYGIKMLMQY